MIDNNNVFPFPVNKAEFTPRNSLNDMLPGLTIDPIELIAINEGGVFESVIDIMTDAQMDPKTIIRIRNQRSDEFHAIIPVEETNTPARFAIEQGTGNRMAVLPISFLANMCKEVKTHLQDATDDEVLVISSRLALAYAFGLIVFDEIDPWLIVDSTVADRVSVRLATGLLCTGLDDGTQDLPTNLIPHYMHESLPKRFACAVAYADLEKYLRISGVTEVNASMLVDAFIERRITNVHNAKNQHGLAVSDIDQAFARPLAAEELQSFVRFASVLRERGMLYPVAGTEPS